MVLNCVFADEKEPLVVVGTGFVGQVDKLRCLPCIVRNVSYFVARSSKKKWMYKGSKTNETKKVNMW